MIKALKKIGWRLRYWKKDDDFFLFVFCMCANICINFAGTTVSVCNIFRNLPVRKQFYSSSKKMADELRRIEYLVKCYSIIHPLLRVTLFHNKCLVWQKSAVDRIIQGIMQAFGHNIATQIQDLSWTSEEVSIDVHSCFTLRYDTCNFGQLE